MDVDTFERMLEGQSEWLSRLIAAELKSFLAPEKIRLEVETYARMSEQARAMLPENERARLERLRRQLAREF